MQKTITIYRFARDSSEYTGEELAPQSPDWEQEGAEQWEFPARSTLTAPTIAPGEGEALIWNSEIWVIVTDNRGKELISFKDDINFHLDECKTIDIPEGKFLYTDEMKQAVQERRHIVLKDGVIVIKERTKQELATDKIAVLKRELDAGDYKISKNAEAASIGRIYPYPPEKLHAERQALRDEINKLESSLKTR